MKVVFHTTPKMTIDLILLKSCWLNTISTIDNYVTLDETV